MSIIRYNNLLIIVIIACVVILSGCVSSSSNVESSGNVTCKLKGVGLFDVTVELQNTGTEPIEIKTFNSFNLIGNKYLGISHVVMNKDIELKPGDAPTEYTISFATPFTPVSFYDKLEFHGPGEVVRWDI